MRFLPIPLPSGGAYSRVRTFFLRYDPAKAPCACSAVSHSGYRGSFGYAARYLLADSVKDVGADHNSVCESTYQLL